VVARREVRGLRGQGLARRAVQHLSLRAGQAGAGTAHLAAGLRFGSPAGVCAGRPVAGLRAGTGRRKRDTCPLTRARAVAPADRRRRPHQRACLDRGRPAHPVRLRPGRGYLHLAGSGRGRCRRARHPGPGIRRLPRRSGPRARAGIRASRTQIVHLDGVNGRARPGAARRAPGGPARRRRHAPDFA